MKTLAPFAVGLVILVGCDFRSSSGDAWDGKTVALLNHATLFAAEQDVTADLIDDGERAWRPCDIAKDEFGAIVQYDKVGTFEELRSRLNTEYPSHETANFANDPDMGIWRIDDPGFTIQLSQDDEEDVYTAIYLRFVDPTTMADAIENVATDNPDLVNDFNWQGFADGLRASERSTEQSDVPESASRGDSKMEDQPRGPGDR
ncbi:hypothetical protein Mal15_62580 [Stieleria maiorica]|uniref:Uncharacterized protein n=2 Tax=Stieleria maiorica TaxID=2795974 RepID=A0A5B9MLK5_9BACT|nr:hypothetical protein Mal15_62580 [Stieleria maiorica]